MVVSSHGMHHGVKRADVHRRFIIDGIITIPIALYGFIMFPDVPTTTKAFYLSEEVRFSAP